MERTDKTRAIVLKAIRYGDNSLIVKLLTEQNGLQSFMVKGAFNKSSKIRAALFQPLTLLEVVCANSRGELGYLREAAVEQGYKTIAFNIKKNAIVIFLCELLSKSIQDSETDLELFQFVHDTLTHLDAMPDNYSDIPLKFAVELSRYIGFAPYLNSYRPNSIFDLEDGNFHHDNAASSYYLDSRLSALFYSLCNCTIFSDDRLNLTNSERRQLLEAMITYYKLHVSGFNEMNSNEILKSVFTL